jgi:hypothetical protein
MREYGALPKSLEVLQLGEIVTDPLSGKPFDYRKTGEQTYQLTADPGTEVGEATPFANSCEP